MKKPTEEGSAAGIPSDSAPANTGNASPGAFPAAGPIGSRAEAYAMLAEAADYLQATEPHSPAPYLVRRAISWGGMPFAEVLKELLEQGSDVDTVYNVLGIEPLSGP